MNIKTVIKGLICLLAVLAMLFCAVSCEQTPDDGGAPTGTSDSESTGAEKNSKGDNDLSAVKEALKNAAINEEVALSPLAIPASSSEFSVGLALQTLTLCSGHTKEKESELFGKAGLKVVLQNGYGKDADDLSHTCAYTVGKTEITLGGKKRTLFVVAIRGTEGGEWYSDIDFAPSHSDEAVFAENFLFAAEDVFNGISGAVRGTSDPVILVCGHSRGGACANLLGMLLDAKYGKENVYAYTFATPATLRDDKLGKDCDNVFNLINGGDLVTALPLAEWGFSRVGKDIMLSADPDAEKRVAEVTSVIFALAPTVSSYYGDAHSLTSAGLSEDGITPFDLAVAILGQLGTEGGNGGIPDDLVSSDSDLYPLLGLAKRGGADHGAGYAAILTEHLPGRYFDLIKSYGK